MSRNPWFDEHLKWMEETHDRKNHDYADDDDPLSNFTYAAHSAGVPVDTVFRVMIGIKLARLGELLASGKSPNNESVDDSIGDLSVYAALWAAYRRRIKTGWYIDANEGAIMPVYGAGMKFKTEETSEGE